MTIHRNENLGPDAKRKSLGFGIGNLYKNLYGLYIFLQMNE